MATLIHSFTKEYLTQLEAFNLQITNVLQSGYGGLRKSKAKGMSLEFSDFRSYSFGDDLRRIDWNSYARFDKLFVKLFMEEKQSNVNIFLDTSASMGYGEPEKAFYSKQLAASIAYIALKNMDRVNIYGCNRTITAKKMDLQTKNTFLETVKFLDTLQIEDETKLVQSILQMRHTNMAKGISIIISDFFSMDGYKEVVKMLQYKNQEVILIQILSPQELNPQVKGNIRLIDGETAEYKDIELTENIVYTYKQAVESYQQGIKAFCHQRGQQYVFLSTEIPIIQGIKQCLRIV
jgi:uncharacterized protein (DUF58 family)